MIKLDKISDATLSKEYYKRFYKGKGEFIKDGNEALRHFGNFVNPNKEQFMVAYLNGRNEIIDTEVLFKGSLTESAVHPRELARRCLELGSAAVLLAHNHPSGNLSPSKEDLKITAKIVKVLKLLDILVHDHIIIGNNDYTSFYLKGLLD
jgi:DNA repair protein RadC|tara:strand:- start:110 stop:559 length:450 start_codon:yes stop_codon:yes gene_type:complete